MADYGLKIFDSDGNVTLDVADTITRLRHSEEVDSDGGVVLSDIDGKSTAQFGISLTTSGMQPLVERSGTTISWTFGGTGVSSLILVFLYD